MRNHETWTKQDIVEFLRAAGVNPTSQRVEVAFVLFSGCQHLSADDILQKVNAEYPVVSKATVYNTLGLLAEQGLIREVIVEPGKVFYDANTSPHHHFYDVDSGLLEDIPADDLVLTAIPPLPAGKALDRVDVVIRVRGRPEAALA
ncbi:Fur family transcriptional regulator [Thermithiobacillus plumbiphilus]|uniref:Ferric uptake regulation protein n=1 Tax=Thermithiobacillus plumbiphilus TaxID=1729899 RepID=A0ABU9D920_9PROT